MPDEQVTETAPSLEQEIDAALAAESETDTQPEPATEVDDTNAAADDEVEHDNGDEPTFTTKVGGKDVEVTLDELLKGYQRQSDYTRKTQELAETRQEAADALALLNDLRNDPQGTLQALTEHLIGLDTDTEDVDPIEQRLSQHEQFIQQQQEQALMAQVEQECSRLSGIYEGFDSDATLQYAIDHDQPSLEAAHLLMQAEMQRESAKAERNAQAAARKKSDPPVAGRSTASGSTAKPPREIHSITDALDAALDDHGASWGEFVRS